MPHELNIMLDAAGLAPARTLREMLDDHPSHCTERRGCGLTQATRFLSGFINQPMDPIDVTDLDMFRDWPQSPSRIAGTILFSAGWEPGWRRLDEAPIEQFTLLPHAEVGQRLAALVPTLRDMAHRAQWPESRILLVMMEQILSRNAPMATRLPGMREKPAIGSCSQAEEFFLEIAHGRIRRGGSVNVIVDNHDKPVMVEKIRLGESHSALLLEPVRIHGVLIPSGGLCALEHHNPALEGIPTRHGCCLPLASVRQARFLRLTTLALLPADRMRAFSAQVQAQVRSRFLSPTTTTMEDMHNFVRSELDSAGMAT